MDDGWMDWQTYVCIYGEFSKGVVGWINTSEWMDRGKDIQMGVYIVYVALLQHFVAKHTVGDFLCHLMREKGINHTCANKYIDSFWLKHEKL